ncbi:caspase family protein [Xanthovirga aplysinae]|uniref:caspase family protein n=1 Tax=Xanthovirga aplysinae TaxID=2529853 RepID=UPI0012BD0D2A|nr:caspase family protein [Xanthovirga aplysinae]MTI31211.1 caspase family protein [Xanthovirga aplysinae]
MGKYIRPLALMSVLLVLVQSCATIINGTTQRVTFVSDPPNADVYINGQKTWEKTPVTMEVPRKVAETFYNRKNEQYYVFKKFGYHDMEYRDFRTQSNLFLWTILNLTTYTVGFWVDLYNQSWNKYSKRVTVNLSPKKVITRKEVVYVEKEGKGSSYHFEQLSDVDVGVPEIKGRIPKRFALIIGNEDYTSFQISPMNEVNVVYARNDASAFKEYAIKTLGIPERNIIFVLDGTTGKMNQALNKLSLLAKNSGGEAELFFFYAGHGLPDEATHLPYLIPVDVNGTDLSSAIKVSTVYRKLTEYPTRRVTVFLDACFSGAGRGSNLLAGIRGIGIKPKMARLQGNLVVFSASQGEQSASVYQDQHHGLFTYFLLKKLKESAGEVSYEELAHYINGKVALESVLLNDKEQNPVVNFSEQLRGKWENWKFLPK